MVEKETRSQSQLNSGHDPGRIWQITDQHDDVYLKGFACAKLKCVYAYVSASVYVSGFPRNTLTSPLSLSLFTVQHYIQAVSQLSLRI